jgi:hypothetical protein
VPNPNQHPNSRGGLVVGTRSGLPRVAAAPHRSHGRWPRCMSHVSIQTQLYASSRSATGWADIGTALACRTTGLGRNLAFPSGSLGFMMYADCNRRLAVHVQPFGTRDAGARAADSEHAHRPRWWFLRVAADPSEPLASPPSSAVQFFCGRGGFTGRASRSAVCHSMVNANPCHPSRACQWKHKRHHDLYLWVTP